MDGAGPILDWLRENDFLSQDGDFVFIGDAAEKHFGRRHFMDLLAVFTAEPELAVVSGRRAIGSVSPLALTSTIPDGEHRVLLLAGQPWRVTNVDWRTRTVSVVEEAGGGRSQWMGGGPAVSLAMSRAMREVLLGEDPPVDISRRASSGLARLRDDQAGTVDGSGFVLVCEGNSTRWWTWAGTRANASLAAALSAAGVEDPTSDHAHVRSAATFVAAEIQSAADLLSGEAPPQPPIDRQALEGLKFADALPPEVARAALAERMTDRLVAVTSASEGLVISRRTEAL